MHGAGIPACLWGRKTQAFNFFLTHFCNYNKYLCCFGPLWQLIVNSFAMPIYYKRLEPFNPLVVSGNSRGLIACCQKGSSGKSSPSLLIVGLLFNSSSLREAAFYSPLVGLKRFLKTWAADAKVSASSAGSVLALICAMLCVLPSSPCVGWLWQAASSFSASWAGCVSPETAQVGRMGLGATTAALRDLLSCVRTWGRVGVWGCQLWGCLVLTYPAAGFVSPSCS